MSFKTIIICNECEETFDSKFEATEHDCPETPENQAKRKEESAEWEEEYRRIEAAWEAWFAVNGDRDGWPSMGHTPSEIAFEGRCVLVAVKDEYFGGDNSTDYISEVLENPTWAEVFIRFSESMKHTGDKHHWFLEGLVGLDISRWPDGMTPDTNITILEFATGS